MDISKKTSAAPLEAEPRGLRRATTAFRDFFSVRQPTAPKVVTSGRPQMEEEFPDAESQFSHGVSLSGSVRDSRHFAAPGEGTLRIDALATLTRTPKWFGPGHSSKYMPELKILYGAAFMALIVEDATINSPPSIMIPHYAELLPEQVTPSLRLKGSHSPISSSAEKGEWMNYLSSPEIMIKLDRPLIDGTKGTFRHDFEAEVPIVEILNSLHFYLERYEEADMAPIVNFFNSLDAATITYKFKINQAIRDPPRGLFTSVLIPTRLNLYTRKVVKRDYDLGGLGPEPEATRHRTYLL